MTPNQESSSRPAGVRRLAVVTGGLGFAGSWLVRELCHRGLNVRILDDGSNANSAHEREFDHHPQVERIVGSTLDRECVRATLKSADELYHLAAVVGVRRVAADPGFVLHSNREGAAVVISECERAGVPFLFVSSSEVYGSAPANRAFRETDAPGFCMDRVAVDGRAAYAWSKWLGERRALEAMSRGLRGVIVRPFNVVGAGQSTASGALIPSLVSAALRGEPLRLEGDGTSTRAFAWVPEVARAFVDLLHCPAAAGAVVNVGGTDVRSIRTVAERILEISGSRSPIQFGAPIVPRGVAPVAHRRADLGRLQQFLGWAPSSPVELAIRDAVLMERTASPVTSQIL